MLRVCPLALGLGLALVLSTAAARAEPPLAPEPPPPPPAGFENKRPINDEDLAKKKEGGYFTGLPLANYDPDTGFGAGARAYYFFDGKRTSPLFAYTPYEHRVFAQTFFSTKGLQFHWLDYDAPALFGSPWRVRSQLIYERNTSRNYFGIGERAQALSFTGAPRQTYDSYAKYLAAQERAGAEGKTYALYDKHLFERPLWLMSLERTLLGGAMRSLVGLGFSHAGVGDYTGKVVDGRGVGAPTRLKEDCDARRIVGCDGGWDNTLRLGLAYDTRDFEPDPNSGFFADVAADFGTAALGSKYDYVRAMAAVRGYYSPIPKLADLVIAARGVYQVTSRGAPFFSMDIFPFTEDPRTGLGGVRTLRGFKSDRFVGRVMALGNLEIRWTFAHARIFGQRFAFIGVPFMDIGRSFDAIRRTTLSGWNRSQGLGLRIAWNLATIIMVDYGVSAEDSGLYVNFTHIF